MSVSSPTRRSPGRRAHEDGRRRLRASGRDGSGLSMPERRLLHDSLLAAVELEPRKRRWSSTASAVRTRAAGHVASPRKGALQDLGLERGDRVVVFTDTSLFCVASIFGTLLAGGVFVVVNPQTKEDKLAYILQDSDAAISSPKEASPVLRREPERLRLAQRRSAEGVPRRSKGWPTSKSSLPAPSRLRALADPADLAALIYTSGSTGRPKGVMMTHQSMASRRGASPSTSASGRRIASWQCSHLCSTTAYTSC